MTPILLQFYDDPMYVVMVGDTIGKAIVEELVEEWKEGWRRYDKDPDAHPEPDIFADLLRQRGITFHRPEVIRLEYS